MSHAEATQVLFGCPQRPLNGNHMEDMITHLAFSGSKVPPKNTVYHIRTLASAVMESCCSFIEAKTQLRAFLFAVFSKNDDPAQRVSLLVNEGFSYPITDL